MKHQHPVSRPSQTAIGDYLFFADQSGALSLYGVDSGKDGSRRKVRLSNSSSTITFDPKLGLARPNGGRSQMLHLVWIGGPEFQGLNYNDQAVLYYAQRRAFEKGRTIPLKL